MYRALIQTLTFMYRFISLGLGKLTAQELTQGSAWADTLVRNAPTVIEPETGDDPVEAKQLLAQAELIDQHIEEMAVWIATQEIV